MGKIKIPGIGLRIIKSSIAIFLCFLVNMLRDGAGIVFYSQLAALWCIQMYRSNTLKNAVQRTIGTTIGAIYGLIFLLLNVSILKTFSEEEIVEALVISIMILLVLYTTVVLKKNQAAYFSCVVFLSIVINHSNDLNPYLFVWNRFLDTMIGIIIGILVNDIRLCIHKDKETLFISGLDEVLINENDSVSPFSKVELNRMIESGMKFTISTMRTPASLIEPLREIKLQYPVIAMDGAVLYDIKKKAYLRIYVISPETSKRVMNFIYEEKMCWYTNIIIDDMLVIFYGKENDDVNKQMVEKLRTSPFRNYVRRPMPENEDVVYFMLFDKTEKIENFYNKILQKEFGKELKILKYPSNDYPGYSYIKIYNKNATRENMLWYLKEKTGIEKTITFGTVEGHCDIMVHSNNFNEMVRKVRGLYEPILR